MRGTSEAVKNGITVSTGEAVILADERAPLSDGVFESLVAPLARGHSEVVYDVSGLYTVVKARTLKEVKLDGRIFPIKDEIKAKLKRLAYLSTEVSVLPAEETARFRKPLVERVRAAVTGLVVSILPSKDFYRGQYELEKSMEAMAELPRLPEGQKRKVSVVISSRSGKRFFPHDEEEEGQDALRIKVRQLETLFALNPSYDWELVIVDDASRNGETGRRVAKKANDLFPEYTASGRIRVLFSQNGNSQKGGGIVFGMKDALSLGADHVVYTDVDLSSNLLLIGSLLRRIVAGGAGIAIGSREHPRARVVGKSGFRKLSSIVYNRIARSILPIGPIADTQSGLKAFSRETALATVDEVKDVTMSFDTEFLLLAREKGFRVEEVPIFWKDSQVGTSISVFMQMFRMIEGLLGQRLRMLARSRDRAGTSAGITISRTLTRFAIVTVRTLQGFLRISRDFRKTDRHRPAAGATALREADLDATLVSDLSAVARSIVGDAVRVLDQFRRRKTGLETKMKTETGTENRTVVTEADEAVQGFIVPEIQRLFPEHFVIAEEKMSGEIARRNRENEGSDFVWVLDPIDGTREFLKPDSDFYAISLALFHKGRPVLAVVHSPHAGMIEASSARDGVYVNGKPVTPVTESPAETFRAVIDDAPQTELVPVGTLGGMPWSDVSHSTRSVALNLARIAFAGQDGEAPDLFWKGGSRGPALWDIAGPSYLLKKAGGLALSLDQGTVTDAQDAVSRAILDPAQRGRHFSILAGTRPAIVAALNSMQKNLRATLEESTKSQDLVTESASLGQKIEAVRSHYDLDLPESLVAYPIGHAVKPQAPVLLRASEGSFVFKRIAGSREKARYVVSYQQALVGKGISSVPRILPLKGRKGETADDFLLELVDGHYALEEALFEGTEIGYGEATPGQFETLGALIAEFQNTTEGFSPEGEKTEKPLTGILESEKGLESLATVLRIKSLVTGKIGRGEEFFLSRFPMIRSQMDVLRANLPAAVYEKLPKALVPMDLSFHNIRFSGDGRTPVSVYDFGKVRYQPRLEDLKNPAMSLGPEKGRTYDRKALDAIVRGYQSVARKPLTPLELEVLPEFIRGTFLWQFAGWFLLEMSHLNTDDGLYHQAVDLFDRFEQFTRDYPSRRSEVREPEGRAKSSAPLPPDIQTLLAWEMLGRPRTREAYIKGYHTLIKSVGKLDKKWEAEVRVSLRKFEASYPETAPEPPSVLPELPGVYGPVRVVDGKITIPKELRRRYPGKVFVLVPGTENNAGLNVIRGEFFRQRFARMNPAEAEKLFKILSPGSATAVVDAEGNLRLDDPLAQRVIGVMIDAFKVWKEMPGEVYFTVKNDGVFQVWPKAMWDQKEKAGSWVRDHGDPKERSELREGDEMSRAEKEAGFWNDVRKVTAALTGDKIPPTVTNITENSERILGAGKRIKKEQLRRYGWDTLEAAGVKRVRGYTPEERERMHQAILAAIPAVVSELVRQKLPATIPKILKHWTEITGDVFPPSKDNIYDIPWPDLQRAGVQRVDIIKPPAEAASLRRERFKKIAKVASVLLSEDILPSITNVAKHSGRVLGEELRPFEIRDNYDWVELEKAGVVKVRETIPELRLAERQEELARIARIAADLKARGIKTTVPRIASNSKRVTGRALSEVQIRKYDWKELKSAGVKPPEDMAKRAGTLRRAVAAILQESPLGPITYGVIARKMAEDSEYPVTINWKALTKYVSGRPEFSRIARIVKASPRAVPQPARPAEERSDTAIPESAVAPVNFYLEVRGFGKIRSYLRHFDPANPGVVSGLRKVSPGRYKGEYLIEWDKKGAGATLLDLLTQFRKVQPISPRDEFLIAGMVYRDPLGKRSIRAGESYILQPERNRIVFADDGESGELEGDLDLDVLTLRMIAAGARAVREKTEDASREFYNAASRLLTGSASAVDEVDDAWFARFETIYQRYAGPLGDSKGNRQVLAKLKDLRGVVSEKAVRRPEARAGGEAVKEMPGKGPRAELRSSRKRFEASEKGKNRRGVGETELYEILKAGLSAVPPAIVDELRKIRDVGAWRNILRTAGLDVVDLIRGKFLFPIVERFLQSQEQSAAQRVSNRLRFGGQGRYLIAYLGDDFDFIVKMPVTPEKYDVVRRIWLGHGFKVARQRLNGFAVPTLVLDAAGGNKKEFVYHADGTERRKEELAIVQFKVERLMDKLKSLARGGDLEGAKTLIGKFRECLIGIFRRGVIDADFDAVLYNFGVDGKSGNILIFDFGDLTTGYDMENMFYERLWGMNKSIEADLRELNGELGDYFRDRGRFVLEDFFDENGESLYGVDYKPGGSGVEGESSGKASDLEMTFPYPEEDIRAMFASHTVHEASRSEMRDGREEAAATPDEPLYERKLSSEEYTAYFEEVMDALTAVNFGVAAAVQVMTSYLRRQRKVESQRRRRFGEIGRFQKDHSRIFAPLQLLLGHLGDPPVGRSLWFIARFLLSLKDAGLFSWSLSVLLATSRDPRRDPAVAGNAEALLRMVRELGLNPGVPVSWAARAVLVAWERQPLINPLDLYMKKFDSEKKFRVADEMVYVRGKRGRNERDMDTARARKQSIGRMREQELDEEMKRALGRSATRAELREAEGYENVHGPVHLTEEIAIAIRTADDLADYAGKLIAQINRNNPKQEPLTLHSIWQDPAKYENVFYRPFYELFFMKLQMDFEGAVPFVEAARDVMRTRGITGLRKIMDSDGGSLANLFSKIRHDGKSAASAIDFYGQLCNFLTGNLDGYFGHIYDELMRTRPPIAIARPGLSYHSRADSTIRLRDRALLFGSDRAIAKYSQIRGSVIEMTRTDMQTRKNSAHAFKIQQAIDSWEKRAEELNSEMLKERIARFKSSGLVIEYDSDLPLIIADAEQNVARVVHTERLTHALNMSSAFIENAAPEEIAAYINTAQAWLDIYTEQRGAEASGADGQDVAASDPVIVRVEAERLRFNLEFFDREDSGLVPVEARRDEWPAGTQGPTLEGLLAARMKEHVLKRYKGFLESVIKQEAEAAKILKTAREIKREDSKPSGMTADSLSTRDKFMDALKIYKELLNRYEAMGMHRRARAIFLLIVYATACVQLYDRVGVAPIQYQCDMLLIALRLGEWNIFLNELEIVLKGKLDPEGGVRDDLIHDGMRGGYPEKVFSNQLWFNMMFLGVKEKEKDVYYIGEGTFLDRLRNAIDEQLQAAPPERRQKAKENADSAKALIGAFLKDPYGNLHLPDGKWDASRVDTSDDPDSRSEMRAVEAERAGPDRRAGSFSLQAPSRRAELREEAKVTFGTDLKLGRIQYVPGEKSPWQVWLWRKDKKTDEKKLNILSHKTWWGAMRQALDVLEKEFNDWSVAQVGDDRNLKIARALRNGRIYDLIAIIRKPSWQQVVPAWQAPYEGRRRNANLEARIEALEGLLTEGRDGAFTRQVKGLVGLKWIQEGPEFDSFSDVAHQLERFWNELTAGTGQAVRVRKAIERHRADLMFAPGLALGIIAEDAAEVSVDDTAARALREKIRKVIARLKVYLASDDALIGLIDAYVRRYSYLRELDRKLSHASAREAAFTDVWQARGAAFEPADEDKLLLRFFQFIYFSRNTEPDAFSWLSGVLHPKASKKAEPDQLMLQLLDDPVPPSVRSPAPALVREALDRVLRPEARDANGALSIERNPLTRHVVTIDGPSGTGKGTAAKNLAKRLGYMHVDLGMIYRALTRKALDRRLDANDESVVNRLVSDTAIELRKGEDGTRVFLDGKDVTNAIRSPEVDRSVADIARHFSVARFVFQTARRIGESEDIVIEGRNAGTDIFPDANAGKFYLITDLAEKARRRWEDYKKTQPGIALEEVERDLALRDEKDRTRKIAPLRQAPDAIVINNTHLQAIEVTDRMESLVRKELSSSRVESVLQKIADEIKQGGSTQAKAVDLVWKGVRGEIVAANVLIAEGKVLRRKWDPALKEILESLLTRNVKFEVLRGNSPVSGHYAAVILREEGAEFVKPPRESGTPGAEQGTHKRSEARTIDLNLSLPPGVDLTQEMQPVVPEKKPAVIRPGDAGGDSVLILDTVIFHPGKDVPEDVLRRFTENLRSEFRQTVDNLREVFEDFAASAYAAMTAGKNTAEAYRNLDAALAGRDMTRAGLDKGVRALYVHELDLLAQAIRKGDVKVLAPVIFYSPEMRPRLLQFIEAVQLAFEDTGDVTAKQYRITLVSSNGEALRSFRNDLGSRRLTRGVEFVGDKGPVDLAKAVGAAVRHPVFGERSGVFFPEVELGVNTPWQRVVRADGIPNEYALLLLPFLSRYFATVKTSDINNENLAVALRHALPELGASARVLAGRGIAIVAEFLNHLALAARQFAVSA
ncbi:MAG: Cytidylate kinase [Candidatus Omnitrophica bacterium ADurb.Bin314]|nr:MAG: Cytidylate kinase [Candidatus Omnitrophica bacterium ADurb.Bin314]